MHSTYQATVQKRLNLTVSSLINIHVSMLQRHANTQNPTQVSQTERLESENKRLHEKVSDLEFYKSRIEVFLCFILTQPNSSPLQELHEENNVLLETKTLLESQLGTAKTRLNTSAHSELALSQVQAKLRDMQQQLQEEKELHSQDLYEKDKLQQQLNAASEQVHKLQVFARVENYTKRISTSSPIRYASIYNILYALMTTWKEILCFRPNSAQRTRLVQQWMTWETNYNKSTERNCYNWSWKTKNSKHNSTTCSAGVLKGA